ncbi:hypothetical protein D3C72_1229050 [compost metagenome]
MKHFWLNLNENVKKINKKKVFLVLLMILLIIAILTVALSYIYNRNVREWIDYKVLNKEISQNDVNSIELKSESNSSIIAYSRYIGVLSKKQLNVYNSIGNSETNIDLDITNPIYESNGRYLAIGENGGQKLYVITEKSIIWKTEIEGTISQVHVNKNGYVAVVISNTSYKTVIEYFDNKGKTLFKKYLSSTRVVDVSISSDNKYLAIGEIDTQGTLIQSNIKIISVEAAKTDPNNSNVYTHNASVGKLLVNLKYQDGNKLYCLYSDSINMVYDKNESKIMDLTNSKITFSSLGLKNAYLTIEEKSSGEFTADSVIEVHKIKNSRTIDYIIKEVAKEIYTHDNIIAINLGTEVKFISTNGWLLKSFVSSQEITNIVVSDNIAGIIYRDRIEIINL